ncbi:FtsK/SpoIIIE domain-containing protein [Mycobacteroides abscessus]|uniref:FtsK/SpoIIIE domain-containing protein n=1 Tax=Mycobacteroides abscessus TaxID=36809 RepID=UPI0005E38DDB|nr:FtsK/SpoIIIE domain-containing protein [Mycobacteroides abscessus]CPW92571.1 DNA segregation ATPase%2C FtsK/SpoIIIE family [Mycobacteroides abscessus]SKF41584.1 DNA segregation ATPase, FtsK/SpoIIIE family [Mycobacteroides abscessus subsp. bolletii]SKH18468.1 DNA segregation ATPase, FtsK/SpoIIIE family [Mycobacteroides abscessus subsp. bolletii]
MSAIGADSDGKIPDFFDVLGIDDIETYNPAAAWARNAHADSVAIPTGYLRVGDALIPELSTLDFSRDGTSGAVQGRTGAGRSYFLRSMVLSLATRYGPDRLSLFLADGMGTATFRGFEALPHTVANVSGHDKPEETIDWTLAVLTAEIRRREDFLASKHCRSSAEYRRERCARAVDGNCPPLPDLVAVIDNFCWVLQENPEKRNRLMDIARDGASAGVHLLLAGEHFSEPMLEGLDALLGFRFSLRVNRPEHSRALIGTDDAAHIPAGRPYGKMLRKLPSDQYPTPMVGFHIDRRYPVPVDAQGDCDAEVQGDKMSDLLLGKLARLSRARAIEPWQLGDVQDNPSRPPFGSSLRRHR